MRPHDLAAVREAVLDVPGRLAVAGAGTAATWGGALLDVDAVLDTTGLTGVIAHNPGDMTVSVRAGTPLRELAAELAPHGQHVAFDAARGAEGATVGGLLATGDAGPGALVHGSLRDLVIGTTVVLADGTVAHSGGHVIKNVAGYDVAKLMHGSYGTLAVIVEVVLRLHPLPKDSATLVIPCALDEAAGHAAAVMGGPFEPAALEWFGDATEGRLLVRSEGTQGALESRTQRLCEALRRAARREPALESAGGAAAQRLWALHSAAVRGAPGAAVLRLGVRPSRLPPLIASLPGVLGVTAGLGTGVATVSVEPDGVAVAHELVRAAGGTSALRTRPAGSTAPAWGPPPSALAVLKAVKTEFDPQGRFGPGRFNPWM